ncbi:MAG: hypothetical protein AMXMBFR84_40360 [Candidatus Hydrogenedentota bacterium]
MTVTAVLDGVDALPLFASSAQDGRFEFPALSSGSHSIDIAHDRYVLVDGPQEVTVGVSTPPITLFVSPGGSITGRVVDAATHEGIGSVQVSATPGVGTLPSLTESRMQGTGPKRSTITDSNGAFQIQGLAPGSYRLQVATATPGYASGFTADSAVNVQVALGESIEGVEIILDRGITAEGLVLDTEDRPVADANLVMRGAILGRSPSKQTVSDSQGRFVFSGLRADQEITISASTDVAMSGEIGPIYVPAEGVQDIRVVLETSRNSLIAGLVVSKQGNPLLARVLAIDEKSPLLSMRNSAQTDAEGRFLIASIAPGMYTMNVTPIGGLSKPTSTIQVVPNQHVEGLRLVYDSDDLLEITGRVVDEEGAPLKAYVEGSKMDGNRMFRVNSVGTLQDGSFRLRNLEPGKYSLWPRAPGFQGLPVETEAGVQGIELVLESYSGYLRVQVTDTGRQPLPRFQIAAIAENRPGSNLPLPASQFTSVNHPEGRFEMPLSPGGYMVEVQADGYLSERLDMIHVENGAPTEITITLKPGDAVVTGIVVNAAGQPVSGASVYKGALPERVESRPDLASAKSGGDGRFELKGVEVDKPLAVSAYHARSGAGTASVTPRANVAQDVRIVLAALGTIQGTVTRGGQPASPLRIAISQGGVESASAFTNNDGAYTVNALPAGLYDVTVQLPPAQPGEPPAQHTRQAEVAGDAVTTVDFTLE